MPAHQVRSYVISDSDFLAPGEKWIDVMVARTRQRSGLAILAFHFDLIVRAPPGCGVWVNYDLSTGPKRNVSRFASSLRVSFYLFIFFLCRTHCRSQSMERTPQHDDDDRLTASIVAHTYDRPKHSAG